jgi:serine/threonine protein kinase
MRRTPTRYGWGGDSEKAATVKEFVPLTIWRRSPGSRLTAAAQVSGEHPPRVAAEGDTLPSVSVGSVVLSPKDRLGPYQIVELIGAGGMGEVYRARDPRLKRDVALKVLYRAAASPEHFQLLSREARAAGSLNHPNIPAVFDVRCCRATPSGSPRSGSSA